MGEKRIVHVLLVEDNPHVAELITDGLEGAARRDLGGRVGFTFDLCENGQVALDRMKKAPPDLIIMDVYMPVMDGAQFLRHVRALQGENGAAERPVPVIALSAGGPSAREAALSAGADVYLDKPIRLAEVVRQAARLLNIS
jgi:CheY-like chemotaxis protein